MSTTPSSAPGPGSSAPSASSAHGSTPPTPDLRWWLRTALLILRRPDLWATAIGQLRRLAPPGWWRRRPHLPLPDPAYLRFRMETQYGSNNDPEPADVVTYLHWVRAEHRSR